MDEARARVEMVAFCRNLYQRQLVVGTDGNLSLRLRPGELLLTPSAVSKGGLEPEQLIVVDDAGRVLRAKPGLKPTSELPLHLVCYQVRPDVLAVIHAHPPSAIAFSVAGLPLSQCLLPELYAELGPVATAAYSTPGTEACPDAVAPLLRSHDAVMMARHGSLTVGRDLRQAHSRLERLEHTARVSLAARGFARVALPEQEVVRRLEEREQAGGPPRPGLCNACGACVGRMGEAME